MLVWVIAESILSALESVYQLFLMRVCVVL